MWDMSQVMCSSHQVVYFNFCFSVAQYQRMNMERYSHRGAAGRRRRRRPPDSPSPPWLRYSRALRSRVLWRRGAAPTTQASQRARAHDTATHTGRLMGDARRGRRLHRAHTHSFSTRNCGDRTAISSLLFRVPSTSVRRKKLVHARSRHRYRPRAVALHPRISPVKVPSAQASRRVCVWRAAVADSLVENILRRPIVQTVTRR